MNSPVEEQPLEPNDPLWETLGKGRPLPAPDPWFTQKVMRHLPPQEAATPAGRVSGWLAWLSLSTPRIWVPVAAALAIALVALQALQPAAPAPREIEPGVTLPGEIASVQTPALPSEDPQVDAVLEDLDALIAYEDTTVSLEEPM